MPRQALLPCCLLIVLAGCAGSPVTARDSQRIDPRSSLTFVPESGTRMTVATSSCTIPIPGMGYRTFLAGIQTATSMDGLVWSPRSGVGLVAGSPTEFLRNPAAIRKSDGTWVMIYEGLTGQSMKFYRAISTDGGAHFTKTPGPLAGGAVMVPQPSDNEFISVPDLLDLGDGRWRIYFVAHGDHIASAVSQDEGMSWTREGPVVLKGLKSAQNVDPDITRLSDGRFRLYFAAPPVGAPMLGNMSIYSATSYGGRSFTLDPGVRVGVSNTTQIRLDPDVVTLPSGGLRMYYGATEALPAPFDLKSALQVLQP